MKKIIKKVNKGVIILFLLASCSNKIDKKIYDLVEKQFQKDSCNVNFSNIIKEDWDSFYIIHEFLISKNLLSFLYFELLNLLVILFFSKKV